METRVHRNGVYYALNKTATKVWFMAHHEYHNQRSTVYECSPEDWDSGNLFGS